MELDAQLEPQRDKPDSESHGTDVLRAQHLCDSVDEVPAARSRDWRTAALRPYKHDR